MKQGDIGKWQEDTENVFYVPLPFSNVLLPHFLPSLAVKKAVKKMGIEFMYYHKINFIFINAFVTFNCKLPKTQMAKFNDWFLGILLYIQTPHHKHFLVDTSEVAYMLNSQCFFSSSDQSRFFNTLAPQQTIFSARLFILTIVHLTQHQSPASSSLE